MTSRLQPATDATSILAALLTPEGRADPYPLYATAHELGPVVTVDGAGFAVTGYAAANDVLRNPGFGVARRASDERAAYTELSALNRSVLFTDAPAHTRMRSLMSSVFTPRRVAGLRPMVAATVDGLLDGLADADGAPVDFMERFAYRLPVTVICAMLGVPEADHRRFRPLASELTTALEFFADPAGLAAADAAARELSGYFLDLVARRRTRPREDLLSALVAARDADDSRLTEEELLANLIVLLVAGFETTTNLLGNGLAILFDRPDVAASLRSGAVTAADFVEEVLRYDSPLQATQRQALTDGLTVAGVPIPRGSRVVVLLGAANRDPRRYDDPGLFDASRRDIQPLSFGAGAHFCLGNRLARLEADVAFTALLARFADVSAAPGAVPTRQDRLILRGYQTLPVALTR